jgi:hypothetical protein
MGCIAFVVFAERALGRAVTLAELFEIGTDPDRSIEDRNQADDLR